MPQDQKNSYHDKVKSLRHAMHEHGVQGYLIPRADEYQGEFVAPYAERLRWLTGFTGSGGCALVLPESAFVLTDGRYTLQAVQQVDEGLFKTGDYIKKPLAKWIAEHAGENTIIGFDPWLHTPLQIEKIQKEAHKHTIILKPIAQNLIDQIWCDQPEKPAAPITKFPDDIAGLSTSEKRAKIAKIIMEQDATAALITMPDSIAWLLNLRGGDIDYIPSILSYALLKQSGALTWFLDPGKISDALRRQLGDDVQIIPPNEMQAHLSEYADKHILIDPARTPIWFKTTLESHGAHIKTAPDPTITAKAIKTHAEQTAIRNAHIADGVALVKFLKFLDEEGQDSKHSEISITQKLKSFRAENPAFKGNSFPTIAGFAQNGAIIHYRADAKTDTTLTPGNLLLVDSGGQYLSDDSISGSPASPCAGTTDITRTIAIGQASLDMKQSFTRVLKGHIALAQTQFPVGTTGAQIDVLARKPLWDVGLDYAHGTGHGVGCYLAVHEDSANISSRGQAPFEPGMLLSNEPGYYKEGAYGIRIENLVFVRAQEEQGGQALKMLHFETISLAPIDRTLILPEMLSQGERSWLNAYHEKVYEMLSPLLDAACKAWLKEQTKAV